MGWEVWQFKQFNVQWAIVGVEERHQVDAERVCSRAVPSARTKGSVGVGCWDRKTYLA